MMQTQLVHLLQCCHALHYLPGAAGQKDKKETAMSLHPDLSSIKLIEIESFDQPELDVYARLSETELFHLYEPRTGLFIAESAKILERALGAGYEPVSVLAEHHELSDPFLAGLLPRCGDVPVFTADISVLRRLTGFPLTRGVLCAMKRRPLQSAESVLEGKSLVAVLESVTNPTNIGAIFRSAAALGMQAVLLTPDCCDPLYRRAIRVSMGTVFQVPWTFFPKVKTAGDESPAEYPLLLREAGFQTIAMALREDSLSMDDPKLKTLPKIAVFLGAEGDGLSSRTIDGCDYTVRIPMAGGVDSLNVAAASAVAFWELSRGRR